MMVRNYNVTTTTKDITKACLIDLLLMMSGILAGVCGQSVYPGNIGAESGGYYGRFLTPFAPLGARFRFLAFPFSFLSVSISVSSNDLYGPIYIEAATRLRNKTVSFT